jgi:magnesium chelatase subunit I
MGIIPSITGKVELVYEGEQEGAAYVAQNLIASAIHTFPRLLSKSRS